jgi:hypothetical protein
MAIITASAVSIYAPKITASAGTITAGNYIPVVQERICLMLNNYFDSEIVNLETTCVFNATARSIVIRQNSWEEYGFKANDDILIYKSIRNDKVVTIESLTTNTCVLTSACSVVDESYSTATGTSVCFALVQWPISVVQTAALMVYFDVDIRDKVSGNIKSRSLGPLSESFTSGDEDEYGYPRKITDKLTPFKLARLN